MKKTICVLLVVFLCLSVLFVGCTQKSEDPLQSYSENNFTVPSVEHTEQLTENSVSTDVSPVTEEIIENANALLPKEVSVEEQVSLPGKSTACLEEYDQFPITVTYVDGVGPFLTYNDLNTLVRFTEADVQIWNNNASSNYDTSLLPFEGERTIEDIIASNENRNEYTECLGMQVVSIYCKAADKADVYYLVASKGTARGIENNEFLSLNCISWQKENGDWKYVSGGTNYIGDRYKWFVDIQPETGYVEVHANKESY